MQKRYAFSLFLLVWCLLYLLASCAPFQAPPTPTATAGPSFVETTPLVIRPPLFRVNNLAWSPDGKRIAVANADGVFQVWEAATGRLISTHFDSNRSTKISLLGWAADGKRIISTILGPAITVQVWDADTGKTLVTFSHSYPVAASHDGKQVAVGSGSSVQIWDTSTGKQVSTFDTATDHVDQIAWSPDDSLLATTNAQKTADGTSWYHLAQVWNAATETQVCTYHNTSTSPIDHLAWSPDHRRIVSISGTGLNGDPVIAQVWDATSCGAAFRLHGALAQAADLAWSPNGTHIASWETTNRPLQVWDAATGNLSFTVGGQYQSVSSQAWSPDGKQIAVVGEPLKMQVFDGNTGRPQITYHVANNQIIITWSPDGQHLASVDLAGTTIWEASADHRITSLAARHQTERAITWSPDGKQIATEDGARLNVGFWDAATGDSFGDLQFYHEDLTLSNYRNATSVAWSPDGAHVADAWSPSFTYGSPGQQVYVWGNREAMCGLGGDCPVSGGSHSAPITSLAWSPDSKRIASASLDNTVLIYDVANQKNLLIYQGHTGAVTAVAWSPDGKYIASASTDKTIHIWDAASGKSVLTLSGHTGTVTAVAWSPTGGYNASAGVDTTVQVWNATTGKTALEYRGHSDAFFAVAWSPDSKRVASAGADASIQIW